MKQTLKFYVLVAGLLALVTFSSCNEDEDTSPKLCIEPPCGTIDADATNITLFIQTDLNIGNIGIVVDESEQALSLNGRDFSEGKLFSCWQIVPTINSSSIVVLIYELDEEVIVGALNVADIQSNQLVISIDGEDAQISDYEACNDTPSS